MLPYAAYLRVYEPVTAFPEPLRSLWAAYAESGRRPRRAQALAAEHGEAVRRLVSVPPVVAPDSESRHAYVRRAGGITYICPWETRLRSWLAFARFRAGLPPGVSAAFVPEGQAERITGEFERWKASGHSLRPHILSSTWHVPLSWFVPFDPAERCLLLGDRDPGGGNGAPNGLNGRHSGAEGHPGEGTFPARFEDPVGLRGPAGAWAADAGGAGRDRPAAGSSMRTLIYVTSMREARRRLERAQRLIATGPEGGPEPAELEAVARHLAAFHAAALVELDYGGLVHLIDDRRLRADESVHEMAVALAALERGEPELAVAMYQRLGARWRPVRALESAN
ncbi:MULTISPECIES: hypothetical protein [Thermomonospora]|uniref:DUF8083 domain-containing protein n=1 Tax=Thermomonospora curvata (strain ATCC 19995 / DSM 43183 / JCM 3096 / KCTC 9072 / NBRC 15933 / NCIMB 10081 / Henssen B9) TaxID=471852 RepID=D1A1H7_THECD|nr:MULTISPECIES: hypothetical protein [Thermomonospora]ACY95899.1 hypothetical protein Tcur_0295 [Thermomonospora curvata DSM 43183]PKK16143.1 MAG: hypothetical protein BUE48_001465 [Thermomonospora sp. CIF 1]